MVLIDLSPTARIGICAIKNGKNVTMHKQLLTAVLAWFVTASISVFAAKPRYATPVWSMGVYDSANLTRLTAVTPKPRLVFKGMSLAELKAKLDKGYDLFAEMVGAAIGYKRGVFASLYNAQAYPASGTIEKIVGDFCLKEGGSVKAVCVEFTDSVEGVCARVIQVLDKNAATDVVMDVAADGAVTYKNYTEKYEPSNTATEWNNGKYGVANLQIAAFVPLDSPSLVWPGATVEDVKDYAISGTFGGEAVGLGLPCSAHNRRVVEEGGVATAMTVEMQVVHGEHLKCVVLRFTDGVDGVCAQALVAKHVTGEEPGYDFSNGDGTYSSQDGQATDFRTNGYGVFGLTATRKAVYASSHDILTSTSRLVWPDVTLDYVTNCWFGCRFTGGHISSSMRGSEGRGCNLCINRDVNGSATNITCQFQIHDGAYIKCRLVEFENGSGGVYARQGNLAAVPTSATEKVGRDFTTITGTGNYDVYDLSAVPCLTLDADEDWSPYGRMVFGDMVIDLNGNTLTAGELSFDTSRTGMVVNTATSTTAQLRTYVFEGGIVSNACVNIGNTCMDTENIRFVKDGKGTYYAAKAVEYSGGTEVVDGVVKPVKDTPGVTKVKVFGNQSGAVMVDAGAALDWNGYYRFEDYAFILAGGTLQNTGNRDLGWGNAFVKTITLTEDSGISATRSWGVIDDGYGEVSLALGGHTLDIAISSGKTHYFANVRATAGRINVTGEGTFYVPDRGNGLVAPETDLCASCELSLHGHVSVRGYVAVATRNGTDLGTAELRVHGTFRPTTQFFRGCTMQNGSTMDFSAWPADAGWPVVTAYTCAGDTTIKFTDDDNVTITVKLGDRRVAASTPVVAWTDETRPDFSNVRFVRGDADRRYVLVPKADGLYVQTGFMLIVK